MARFRLIWGLFALAATFVAFLVLLLVQGFSRNGPAAEPVMIESLVAAEVADRFAVPSVAPTVTRLADVAALEAVHPAFYADVRDGDWMLRYPGLVIVYRREEGRIVKAESTP